MIVQINFNRAAFAAAFSVASIAVPSRTPKDILRNVLMIHTKKGTELLATDLEISVRCKVGGTESVSSGSGEALLPTKRISDILREMNDESINIDCEDERITIKTASGRFKLIGEDAREYPPIPEFKDDDYFRVPAQLLRQAIKRVSFATDSESTRYALGGVLFEVADGKLTLAATDSRRLAVVLVPCETIGKAVIDKTTVVPTKAVSLLERSLEPKTEFVDIAVATNSVMFRSGDVTIHTRVIEGRFPRYQQVIPRRSNITLPVVAGPLHSVVRQSQIVTDEENRGVLFAFSKGKLTLSSKASSVGDSNIELPIEYDDDDVAISLEPKYVSDFLKVVSPETICDLSIEDSDTAVVFRVEDSYTYVVMPLATDR